MSQEEKVVNNTENQEVKGEAAGENVQNSEDCAAEQCDTLADETASATVNEAALAEQCQLWQDKYARLSAEFDNYRKRTLKEKSELIGSASEDVITAVLPIVDDFDRAIAASENSDDAQSLKEGMALIHKRLVDILKGKGVAEIEAQGADLDTDFHDAVARFNVDDDKKGKVVDVVEKGYKLKDKVIRFAKVVVGI